MVNEGAETTAPGEAFAFIDELHYQKTRQGIVAALRARIENCDSYFGEVCLYDFADEAIEKSVLGGKLDTSNSPLTYMANLATWSAQRRIKSRPPVDLMEPVTLEACALDRQGSDHLDCSLWGHAATEEAEESRIAVWKALRDLPENSQLRTVIELRVTHGLTSKDAAERLGIPVNQVYQQWHRGIARLRNDPAIRSRVRVAHWNRNANPAAPEERRSHHDRSEE
ncbi:sigma-70 family RNA polymerase sigma factor [Streptomyces sp. NPDC006704]|uniref:sigma-70 family RNA polymerase sigma factor n=1 Tax=Streptomyces sp. NPDC006704 TaxID=3364760 RepID=UPI0036CE4617